MILVAAGQAILNSPSDPEKSGFSIATIGSMNV